VLRVSELDLKATAAVGAPACVIHFPNNTRNGKISPETMHDLSSRLYSSLVPAAEKYGARIALETFGAARIAGDRVRDFFACPNEFKKQYDGLNTKMKTMCVDTGHTHGAEIYWCPSPENMIRTLGKDVTLLHMHDNKGKTDDHLLSGMGTINWPAVFDALDEIGYQGVYNFELDLGFANSMLEEYTHFAGKYLRNFVDNHGTLK
jgi:sugar phosphate isomerase/epimerase